MHDFHQVIDQAFKDVQFTGQTHIVHALGIIGTQSGTHASGKKNSCYLALFNCVNTRPCKAVTICLDLV